MLFRKRERPKVAIKKKVDELAVTIHNMSVEKPYQVFDVKCDRSSFLGSKFYLKGDESRRGMVCRCYDDWFKMNVLAFDDWEAYEELMRIRDLLRKHDRLRIFCWCAPKRCHCQTIARWLEENV